jgi:hypothetical protein
LKATEPVKVDYTDLLVNPSFEYFVKNGAVDLTDPIDVTKTTDTRLYNSALRGTPPGWQDSENIGTVVSPATSISYGVNRGALNKDGYNHVWFSPGQSQLPLNFTLYQNVTGLPAGQYLVSCKLYTTVDRLSNQRLFASTGATNTVSQYFGLESDYRVTTTTPATTNIVDGESYSFANWLIYSTTGDAEARLKPMSVVITVAEGEVLTVGIKTSRLKKDGTTPTSNIGFFKADDFRITRLPVPEDPNDYTYKITNPDFEQILVDGVPTQLKTHAIDRDTPYGWSDINRAGLTPVTGNLFYGVKTEANNAHGAKSCWAQKSPFPDNFTLYQNITGIPTGKYKVSCLMFLETGMVTNQRLFANNNVTYFGSAADYESNKTVGEINSFAGLATSLDDTNNRLMREMSVEVDVTDTLRIGIKTTNIKGTGLAGTGKEGWFTVDNFRLQRIGDLVATGNSKLENTGFFVNGQKNGFFLNMDKATLANVKVLSLSGQAVYASQVNSTNTWISLPQGLYIVQVSANGTNKAVKVQVK